MSAKNLLNSIAYRKMVSYGAALSPSAALRINSAEGFEKKKLLIVGIENGFIKKGISLFGF